MNADCVVLAAGLSSRMGQNKMLLDIGGKTVIERCIGAFYDSCSKIIVVTGKYHEGVRQCLAPYPKVCIVHNENYLQGMFSSIKRGLGHVSAPRFFLTPGDYPLLQIRTVRLMLDTAGHFVAPVYCGRPGHPILLDKSLIPAILSAGDASLRDCLARLSPERREVPVSDIGVVTDTDTEEQYTAALEIYRRARKNALNPGART